MDAYDTYLALLASQRGVAVPKTSKRHTHLVERPFAIVGYHLAGEQSAPLALMFGDGPNPDDATMVVVAEPRNREARFEALAQFGSALNDYLASCPLNERSGPQIMFANPATAHWLLGLVGRFTRNVRDAPASVPEAGKNLSALRGIMITPGSSMVYVSTDVLTAHFKTGQLSAEDLNIGALLGWVDPAEGLTGPEAARIGEQEQSPAGPLTDPHWDADYLEDFSKRWRRASTGTRDNLVLELERALRDELRPTWQNVWRSREIMAAIPAATHAASRYSADLEDWDRHRDRMASVTGARFMNVPPPTASAWTLARHESRQTELDAYMALDDPVVLAGYISKGEALDGMVTSIDLAARHEGKQRPLLTVTPAVPCDVAQGDRLFLVSHPSVELLVVGDIRADASDPVQLRVVKGANTRPTMTRLPGADDRFLGSPLKASNYYKKARIESVPWTHALETAS